jgi:hypothetical protein
MAGPIGSGGLTAEILAELREQTKWLRFMGLRALGPILESALRNDRERLAYELSDGRSSNAVGAAVGVTGRSIINWWQRWAAAGIADEQPGGRVVRLASLTQLGVPVPAIVSQDLKAGSGENDRASAVKAEAQDA